VGYDCFLVLDGVPGLEGMRIFEVLNPRLKPNFQLATYDSPGSAAAAPISDFAKFRITVLRSLDDDDDDA